MRFSTAIAPVVAREPAPLPSKKNPAESRDPPPEQPVRPAAQEPPPDLDQRVRLSGEW